MKKQMKGCETPVAEQKAKKPAQQRDVAVEEILATEARVDNRVEIQGIALGLGSGCSWRGMPIY